MAAVDAGEKVLSEPGKQQQKSEDQQENEAKTPRTIEASPADPSVTAAQPLKGVLKPHLQAGQEVLLRFRFKVLGVVLVAA